MIHEYTISTQGCFAVVVLVMLSLVKASWRPSSGIEQTSMEATPKNESNKRKYCLLVVREQFLLYPLKERE